MPQVPAGTSEDPVAAAEQWLAGRLTTVSKWLNPSDAEIAKAALMAPDVTFDYLYGSFRGAGQRWTLADSRWGFPITHRRLAIWLPAEEVPEDQRRLSPW